MAALVAAGCSSSKSSGGGGGAGSLVLGSPGIPPVVSGLLPYIADKQVFYKKYGVNVTIKNFQTRTDATRAVATGQIDLAIMPPAQLVQLASRASRWSSCRDRNSLTGSSSRPVRASTPARP